MALVTIPLGRQEHLAPNHGCSLVSEFEDAYNCFKQLQLYCCSMQTQLKSVHRPGCHLLLAAKSTELKEPVEHSKSEELRLELQHVQAELQHTLQHRHSLHHWALLGLCWQFSLPHMLQF